MISSGVEFCTCLVNPGLLELTVAITFRGYSNPTGALSFKTQPQKVNTQKFIAILFIEAQQGPVKMCKDDQVFKMSSPGANFTNRLKLSQLSLCIRFKPKNRLKSVHEISPC